MSEWLNITEYNWVLWVAGLFALLEFGKWAWSLIEWFISKLGIETKHMRSQREVRNKLLKAEQDIAEIRDTSTQNVNTFLEHERLMSESFADVKNEIVQEIGKLHNKIDEQHVHLEEIDRDGKRRDATIFRDRLLQSHRYYNQRRNTDGLVYLSISEFENLQNMFKEYFAANGNGVIKQIYEQDFQPNFRIDNESIDTYRTK